MNIKSEPLYSENIGHQNSHTIDNIAYIFSLLGLIFVLILLIYDIFIERLDANSQMGYQIFFIILIILLILWLKFIKYWIIYQSYPIKLYKNELEFPILWIERLYRDNWISYNDIEKILIKYQRFMGRKDIIGITIITRDGKRYHSGFKSLNVIKKVLHILKENGVTNSTYNPQ